MSNILSIDPIHLIQAAGLVGIFVIIFAETGLLIGFFLPGDSLLVPIGILASQGYLNPWYFAIIASAGAILGDATGYFIGRRFGRKILTKKNSFFYNEKHIERTEKFYQKYGVATILIARFTPIVRTIAPTMAGVAEMPYKKFFFWNVLGGIVWPGTLIALGYWFGQKIPNVDKYIIPSMICIVVLFALPVLFQVFKKIFSPKEKTDK